MSIDEGSEFMFQWLIEQYKPLVSAQELETAPKIAEYKDLSNGLIIVGSASPRNGRIRNVIPDSNALCTLSSSQIKRMLKLGSAPYIDAKIINRIMQYEEPRRSWEINADGEAQENGLSLAKARITAAAAILEQQLSAKAERPSFKVIGRDYNLLGSAGKNSAQERPGFTIPKFADKNVSIPGWVRDGEGPKPTSPAEQCKALYDPNKPFYTANSTTVLEVGEYFYSHEGLEALTNLEKPIDPLFYKTRLSFMGLLPNKAILDGPGVTVYDLIGYYSNIPLDQGGNGLYQPPGVVDWSRPPFRDQLKVWRTSDGEIISQSYKDLGGQIASGDGRWINYSQNNGEGIADELVGISTHSLAQIMMEYSKPK